MTHKVILWSVAVLLAAVALVAGCMKVDVPKGPYMVMDRGGTQTAPKDRSTVKGMSRVALENEVLRLASENTRLRQEVEGLKRKNKLIDKEKDRLEDRVEDLQDQIKDLRKR